MFEGPLYDDFLEKDQESNERSCEQHHPFFKFYVCAVRGSIDPNGSAHIIPKIIRELQKVEHLAAFFAGYEFSRKSDRPIFLGAWRAVQDRKIIGRIPKSPRSGRLSRIAVAWRVVWEASRAEDNVPENRKDASEIPDASFLGLCRSRNLCSGRPVGRYSAAGFTTSSTTRLGRWVRPAGNRV